ncbi:hypothetical protein VRU48_19015 [Pedobacter sp. KR3-3]|uniref:Uncharacterized protein n=1 Tax=Pedobacter albus TaxID=3113905 RepID=A0ABU7ICX5_9SPHI|nr:hypothetical protein [Pedobacter sp. KR3-3]MEE1947226.1 hypothetical protein [Pedobacter sp. KR3-3]
MNIAHFLTQAAIMGLGGIIAVTVAYFLVKGDIQHYFRFKSLEDQKEERATLLPLRLQAYERVIIFIERINPTNLLVRLHQSGIELSALQALIINEVNAEYQHNITQQLYINAASWNVVRKLKDDTIAMINNTVAGLPPEASGIDLSRKILKHMSSIEENPYQLTIDLLKQDIHILF